mgnify:CR=1 FL=1
MSDAAPFDIDNFLNALLGPGPVYDVIITDVIDTVKALPLDINSKKYVLILWLDRVDVELESWMVERLRDC